VPADSVQADQLWEAMQDSLRRHRFQLDRVDRRAGVMTTLPEGSQHFFEIWRKDVATRTDWWAATLNPIRRWVEASISPGEDGLTKLVVVVHKERLSSPDRQFNNSGAAFQYFAESLPSTTGLARVTAADDRWLDLGRDPAMEDRLLHDMLNGAGLEPVAASETHHNGA